MLALSCALVAAVCSACATTQPVDYSAFRQHMPRSIVVLPPLNESVEADASYSYLSTVSMPLGEAGYYVFPVAVIDAFLKDNGLPTPGEMHTVSLAKIKEIFGADAILYVNIEDWGQKYVVLSSNTVVRAKARLVDVDTGAVLWEGTALAQEGSGGTGSLLGDIIAAAIEQMIDTSTDEAHRLARQANFNMVHNPERGLLYGPYHPKYGQDSRGR